MSEAPHRYPSFAYDKHICLKLSLGMWAAILYLLRPYVVVVASVTRRGDRMAGIEMVYHDPSLLALSALASLPAMLLLYAYAQRQPEAAAWVRKVWTNGAKLLMLSAGINLLIAGWTLLQTYMHPSLFTIAQLVISVLILMYLRSSTRVRDTFGDFPSGPA